MPYTVIFFMETKCENCQRKPRMKVKKYLNKKRLEKSYGNALKRHYFDKCPSAEEFMLLSAKMSHHCVNHIIFMQTTFLLSFHFYCC